MNDPDIAALRAKLNDIAQTLAQAKQNGQTLNEAQTELIIIDPLLQALGYHPLEYGKQGHNKLTGAIPDYTPLPDTPHTWFLEGKAFGFPLSDKEAAQAVNYATNHGARWAVLTNGRAWYIYDAHLHKPLNEKRVFQVDDVFAAPQAAETLYLLSRASMTGGGLMTALAARQLDAITRRELLTPRSTLRKSLQATVRKETGGIVSDEAVGAVIIALIGSSDNTPNRTALVPHSVDTAVSASLPSGDWHTLAELVANAALVTNRNPALLSLGRGAAIAVKSWSDVTRAVVEWIGVVYGLPPLPFIVGSKSKKFFLNTAPTRADGEPMITHILASVAGQSVAVDANKSAHDKAKALFALLAAVHASADSVRVEVEKP